MRGFVEELSSPLTAVVPAEPVTVRGSWSTHRRKAYSDASQLGTGTGPFVEVVDSVWAGTFESAVPLAGIALMCTPGTAWWAKSSPAGVHLPVRVSLTASSATTGERATFAGSFHGAFVPWVPVDGGQAGCRLGTENLATGRPHVVAEVGDVAFAAVLLPEALLKVGRNRLWRLRDAIAPGLPSSLAELLTRRRAGEFRLR